MQITPLITSTPGSQARHSFDVAVMNLDWAHETAGTAVSDADYVTAATLLSASEQASIAASLLDGIHQSLAAEHARTAANAFDSAATAKLHEDPDVAADVVAARGEDAEHAIHAAFTALGLDGRGE